MGSEQTFGKQKLVICLCDWVCPLHVCHHHENRPWLGGHKEERSTWSRDGPTQPTYNWSQAQPTSANPKEHEQEAMIVVLSPDLGGGLLSSSVVEIGDGYKISYM